MFLTALSLNTESALNERALVLDQVSRLEVLEARFRLIEEGPHSGDSEAEAEEASGDNVAPNPQAPPILKQRVKREQPLGPGGVAAGNPAVTEFTTYTPYTPTELQELGGRTDSALESQSRLGYYVYGMREQTTFSAPRARWKS
ncbi:hypothetical protein mRhiFer1_009220 [Rhinolophus ferrumequinum]|uniref:Uncharacterized protein n=1 Tax=Rhinolophus ferrumequinum TaxID=59479 RepID=A0A7J7S8F0_RHIFE|nr:hypothetical protein mRhiFer1_009220 [Rhinolophus ferrumequinum]